MLSAEMYGPPRRCKDLWSILTIDSLRKCIRPLASGLLLQPGHDEIRARRFHKACSGRPPAFGEGLTTRRSTVSSSSSNLAILVPNLLRGRATTLLVESPRSSHDHPGDTSDLRGKGHNDLVDVHPRLELA